MTKQPLASFMNNCQPYNISDYVFRIAAIKDNSRWEIVIIINELIDINDNSILLTKGNNYKPGVC